MKTKDCVHAFVSTEERGVWKVEAVPLNKRGNSKIETVYTTIFKCSKCGAIKEYPDTWEKNYIAPDEEKTRPIAEKIVASRKKEGKKHDKINSA